MIAKHIPMRSRGKSDFGALARYLMDAKGRTERVLSTRIRNCLSGSVSAAISEIVATQQLNTRAASDKTYHLLISFPPGELPEEAVLEAIEDRICAGLGFGEHQRLSVVHHDTDHLHLHVAINKIHPTRRTLHDPYQDYRTLGTLCEGLELEYGLQRVAHAPQRSVSEGRARDMEMHSGAESLLSRVRRECASALRSAGSWAELHAQLEPFGVSLRERGRGLVFLSREGVAVKASSVDRAFSRGRLEERLGAYAAPAASLEPRPVELPGPVPLAIPDTSELYARYQVERATQQERRDEAWEELRSARLRRVDRARRDYDRRRRLIRTLARGRLGTRMLYAQAARSHRSKLQDIRRTYRTDRTRLFERHPRLTWLDWLQQAATAGDPEALRALRARGGAAGQGRGAAALEAPVEHVTKRGTILYGGTHAGVRDDGQELVRLRDESDGRRAPARRQGPDAGVEGPQRPELSAEEAVARYVAERQASRARGVPVPIHRVYAPTADALAYGGIRRVGGHALVLLRAPSGEVLVRPAFGDEAQRLRGVAIGTPIHAAASPVQRGGARRL